MNEQNSHSTSSLDHCRIISLPRHRHPNGSLTVVENDDSIPFAIKRVFYLYDVPGDSERGGHSHHKAQELIVAVSGSFDITLTDGHRTEVFTLKRPYEALYIEAGIWRSLNNFSSGSVSLVLTSEKYDEADYVRDFNEFQRLTAHKI
ncbi:MAG: WxcM-like domain-containing protein [Bacteroidales bacterium]|nr:WxcM-like domain-containing protein [Bacteroidales bacterium]MDE6832432.1 FdtA/QdtA family cupin domain-containing protein [Muribaculaceae bacterium]